MGAAINNVSTTIEINRLKTNVAGEENVCVWGGVVGVGGFYQYIYILLYKTFALDSVVVRSQTNCKVTS